LAKEGVISRVQLQETRQAFVVAVGKLERVKAAQNPSASAVEVATERIAQERARGEASLATLSRERKELLQRRITTQNQLNKS
jgi:HlyD family secretion protein